jgi:hypothetical protein
LAIAVAGRASAMTLTAAAINLDLMLRFSLI